MKKFLLVACVACIATTTRVPAQGSLTPPAGPPGPVMKTLDQVEARRPLVDGQPGVSIDGNGTININQKGSYYLTGNLIISAAGANGISVNNSNVTVDLNGYSLICSSANGGAAVNVLAGSNVRITNGTIEGGTTWSGTAFSLAGWNLGIYAYGVASGVSVSVSDVSVRGTRSAGIFLNEKGSRIERCSTEATGGAGLAACVVLDSTAINAGGAAILAHASIQTVVNNCIGATVGSNTTGISASKGVVQNSQGSAIGGSGLIALNALNCNGTSSTGVGLDAEQATNCSGTSTSSNGINAGRATNCTGISFGGSGRGILANSLATNCEGQSVGNYAIDVNNGTASFCRGFRTGGGVAIFSAIAIGCTVNAGSTVTATNSKHLGTP